MQLTLSNLKASYVIIIAVVVIINVVTIRAFVSLLEYAEEELEVTHVVACLDRSLIIISIVIIFITIIIMTSTILA